MKEILMVNKDELFAAIDQHLSKTTVSKNQKVYVYGINGLASILGCSRPTAQRIKSSGKLDAAISQSGRTIVIDVDKALELIRIDRKLTKKYPYYPQVRK